MHHLRLLHQLGLMAAIMFFPVWLFADAIQIIPELNAEIGVLLIVDGCLHWLQNILAFTLLKLVTSLTYAVANVTKRIAVISVSLLLLKNPVTWVNMGGMAMAIFGRSTFQPPTQKLKAITSLKLLSISSFWWYFRSVLLQSREAPGEQGFRKFACECLQQTKQADPNLAKPHHLWIQGKPPSIPQIKILNSRFESQRLYITLTPTWSGTNEDFKTHSVIQSFHHHSNGNRKTLRRASQCDDEGFNRILVVIMPLLSKVTFNHVTLWLRATLKSHLRGEHFSAKSFDLFGTIWESSHWGGNDHPGLFLITGTKWWIR